VIDDIWGGDCREEGVRLEYVLPEVVVKRVGMSSGSGAIALEGSQQSRREEALAAMAHYDVPHPGLSAWNDAGATFKELADWLFRYYDLV